MDRDVIEAEFLACAGLCINDFYYGHKDILVLNTKNEKILEFLDMLNCNIYYIGDLDVNLKNVKMYSKAIELKQNKFDLIIDLDNKTSDHYLKLLKDNALVIINLANLESSLPNALDSIKNADFTIRMPFKVGDNYYLFLSNKIHPLADICLQKIDMLDNLQYYNAKIHEAAFAMPNYLKEALKGIVRN